MRGWHPLGWSLRTRRVFLILLPVSFPAWLTYLCLLLIVIGTYKLVTPLAEFWNAPPRRNTYKYGTSSTGWSVDLVSDLKVVPLKRVG